MSKIRTIVDKDGDVWTGREERKGPGLADLALIAMTGGAWAVTLGADAPTTVVVNGERHSGKKV
jgi:hypothetical protein